MSRRGLSLRRPVPSDACVQPPPYVQIMMNLVAKGSIAQSRESVGAASIWLPPLVKMCCIREAAEHAGRSQISRAYLVRARRLFRSIMIWRLERKHIWGSGGFFDEFVARTNRSCLYPSLCPSILRKFPTTLRVDVPYSTMANA